jgi:hypothetical protein
LGIKSRTQKIFHNPRGTQPLEDSQHNNAGTSSTQPPWKLNNILLIVRPSIMLYKRRSTCTPANNNPDILGDFGWNSLKVEWVIGEGSIKRIVGAVRYVTGVQGYCDKIGVALSLVGH